MPAELFSGEVLNRRYRADGAVEAAAEVEVRHVVEDSFPGKR
jgi:hypothetical protein